MSWVIAADDKYDGQLKMGIIVEKEHADTIQWLAKELGGEANEGLINEAAKRIAEDHLKELPDYYTRLESMESAGKRKEGTDKSHKNLKENLGQ